MARLLIYGWFFFLLSIPWFIGCWVIAGGISRMIESWMETEGGLNHEGKRYY